MEGRKEKCFCVCLLGNGGVLVGKECGDIVVCGWPVRLMTIVTSFSCEKPSKCISDLEECCEEEEEGLRRD